MCWLTNRSNTGNKSRGPSSSRARARIKSLRCEFLVAHITETLFSLLLSVRISDFMHDMRCSLHVYSSYQNSANDRTRFYTCAHTHKSRAREMAHSGYYIHIVGSIKYLSIELSLGESKHANTGQKENLVLPTQSQNVRSFFFFFFCSRKYTIDAHPDRNLYLNSVSRVYNFLYSIYYSTTLFTSFSVLNFFMIPFFLHI